MKITYIYHSCFTVELPDAVLIFDYYKGSLPAFDHTKKIFVFSSHKHHDHFNKEIFTIFQEYPQVTYILSKDIKMTEKYMERLGIPLECEEKITYVGKDRTISLGDNIQLTTLTSTDEGVAFYLEWNDKVIYFAGDLNWWTWNGETKEEYEDMTARFQREIKKLSGKHIDVAFLPLDPRQEDRFYLGFDYFMRNTCTDIAFPMHMWEDYSVIERLKSMEESKDYRNRMMEIRAEGDTFEI